MITLAAINWHSTLFLLFALVTCVFALAVVFSNNIVHMAFFLTISLGSTAGLFFLAGAEFVGAMQFMIYVGGTLVLLVFGVMLTAQSRFISMKTSAGEWVMAIAVGGALMLLLLTAAFRVTDWHTARAASTEISLTEAHDSAAIGGVLTGYRPDKLEVSDPTMRAGMSGYMLPFLVVSMHLLVVLIGASYLARAKKRIDSAVR